MQEYKGRLSFTTDAWTSPNHRAYVAVAVYLERKGEPFSMILDIVEVAQVTLLLTIFPHLLTLMPPSPIPELILQLHWRIFLTTLRSRKRSVISSLVGWVEDAYLRCKSCALRAIMLPPIIK